MAVAILYRPDADSARLAARPVAGRSLAFAGLRVLAPALLPGLAALVAVGSQCYWTACWSRIRRACALRPATAGVAPR